MEKVIKIATGLIIVTLLFLFLFNLRRWLRKKGYFNNNKVVDQETNDKVNKNISKSSYDKDDLAQKNDIPLYIGTFFVAVIYLLSLGEFKHYGSSDFMDVARTIGSLIGSILGILFIPAIISWIINRVRKANDFPLTFLLISIILLTLSFIGNLSRRGVI